MAGESKVVVVAALLGNLVIAVLKLGAGIVANSSAMLAESAHSFSDVGNQVLLLVGIARSKRPPSEAHPYGTAKAAYLWPMLVAILLFGVAGGYSLYEGVQKILHPHEVGDIRLALGVLGVAFVIEIVVLSVAVRQAVRESRARGIHGVRAFLDENRDATLLTVLVEDILALVGLPIAALALGLSVWTGNPVWDGIGSILIGALLMGFALFLGYEVQQLLLGVGLSKRDLARARGVLLDDPAVTHVVSLQSMYLGPDVVLLGVEVDLRDDLDGQQVEQELLRLERALIAALPALRYVYLEPKRHERPLPPPRAGHEAGPGA